MNDNFIPIKVWKEQKYETWQLDISNLSLSELIKLRNSLIGNSENGVRVIDGIVNANSPNTNTYYRECKRKNKDDKRKRKIKNIKKNSRRNKLW